MNQKQYLEFHKGFCKKMTEIVEQKNKDYSGFGNDAFANFTLVEKAGIASAEQGFLTRMLDKIARISSYLTTDELQVTTETIQETLLDLANYSILLAGYLESKKVLRQ